MCRTVRSSIVVSLLVMVPLTVVQCGCRGRDRNASEVEEQAAASLENVPEKTADDRPPGSENDATRSATSPLLNATDDDTASADDTDADLSTRTLPPEVAADSPPSERLLLLTPGGPLVVDLRITIDGAPFSSAMDSVVEAGIALGDADLDGRATWMELTDHRLYRSGALGNEMITDENRPGLIRRHDLNRDGLVDGLELRRFLTRASADSGSFRFVSANYHRERNRPGSFLLQRLDIDRDGRLNRDECQNASIRLRALDVNHDDLVQLEDLVELNEERADPLSAMSRFGAETGLTLDPSRDWEGLLFVLTGLYAENRALTAGSFPLTPGLFESIDVNGDGYWEPEELSELCAIDSHLKIDVAFGNLEPADSHVWPPLEVERRPGLDSTMALDTRTGTQVLLKAPALQMQIVVVDQGANTDPQDQTTMYFQAADTDGNGYVDTGEVEAAPLPLGVTIEALDLNGDEMLYPDEFQAYARAAAGILTQQVQVRLGDREDALFAFLDKNDDQRLTSRELDAMPDRLALLDKNGDGWIESGEIPGAVLLAIGRGGDFGVAAIAKRDPGFAGGASTPPDWFRGMDLNNDGDLTPQEFLGAMEIFRQLDGDSDGYVEAEEAVPDGIR